MFYIYPKYSDRKVCVNSVDLDQTAAKQQFDLGLHCLAVSKYFYKKNKKKQSHGLVEISEV